MTTTKRIPATVTISELLELLKAANDGGDIVRSSADGLSVVKHRSGITIYADGHGWFAGEKFNTVEQLIQMMERKADTDRGTNDLPERCMDCGVVLSRCLCVKC